MMMRTTMRITQPPDADLLSHGLGQVDENEEDGISFPGFPHKPKPPLTPTSSVSSHLKKLGALTTSFNPSKKSS